MLVYGNVHVAQSFWYTLKHGPNWLVCVPLGIHLSQLTKRVNAVSNNIINCATGPKRELCSAK